MTQGDDHSSLMSQINVTPFVDVMLVLLIIFMVTAPMMMEGINVSLPEASSKPLVLEKKPLVISINSDNKIFINDFNVTVEHLGEKLLKIIDGKTNREVFLKADKNISYGMVVRVMSEIKGAGIENLGMVTLPINEKTRK
ncbi:MAG: protein TolR [Deltaproteobacteria bacterium]|nr:protein TolR [Deltaproteobacteria bacterium]MBT8374132.1 protein TolR [Deltaproteobacteria bacterium]